MERAEIIVITVIKIHGLFVVRSEERRASRSRWPGSLRFICPRAEEVLPPTDAMLKSRYHQLVRAFLPNNLSRDS